ncbi:hypothetical protein R3I94_013158 [Phoxinus phoxinus]
MPGISEFIKQPVEGDTSLSPSNTHIKPMKPITHSRAGDNLSCASTFLRGGDVTRSSSHSPAFGTRHQTLLILPGLNSTHSSSEPV